MKITFPYSRQIASIEAVEFRQGKALKHGEPLIVPEHPWEGVLTYLYGSVVKTTLYRMWYQAHGVYVAYARSRDGIVWEKPLFDGLAVDHPRVGPTVESPDGGELCAAPAPQRSLKSNVVLDFHMPTVIEDPADRARPYKLFGYTDRGYGAAFSQDGVHFKLAEANPVIPLLKFPAQLNRKTWYSDVAPVFKDSCTGKFVSHVKTYACDDAGRIRRCVGRADSEDFIHWTEPTTIWAPGAEDDRLARERGFQWADFYGLCGFNYGDGYLGLLWLFFIDYEIERGTHEGKLEVFLAGSPDGRSWKRWFDTPLIPLGSSAWDSGMITTASQPLLLDDGIRLYYGGANFSHGVGEAGNDYDEKRHRFCIGLATLRRDGFVYACAERGRLTTTPMESKTGRLKINADCTDGRITVDIVQMSRKVESFTLSRVDDTDHVLEIAARGSVALEIHIENARLYSLEAM
ncbi:MAG TPA: hypothetical protein VMT22_10395 [Terriglobales bacterium]|nr:hypothetical protein [Terriglobales bacterium]